uniref:Rab-GAP TBC domain-containing protein n=1 Tax=Alexandrium monilatum TaxID=311494 RepID=A0A7S4TBN1_9DINO|mmetsp:Transcript_79830/g.248879  ORF Transcript_79830/g.248879 Transcript_79830/m.248879 type:complete len:592 (-) Transcript_79830:49-1824(-)
MAQDDVNAQLRELTLDSVLQSLQTQPLFWRAKQLVKEEVIKPQRSASDVPVTVAEALKGSSLLAELKAVAHERVRQLRRQQRLLQRVSDPKLPLPPLPVPVAQLTTLDAVEWARRRWAEVALERLRELSREQRQPFLRPRVGASAGGAGSRADGAAAVPPAEPEEVTTRFVLDMAGLYTLVTVDLREHVVKRRSAASAAGKRRPALPSWSQLGLQFHAEPLEALRVRYRELSPTQPHLGVRAGAQASAAAADLLERRHREGLQLLRRPYAPDLLAFARLGVPPGLRQAVWAACLPSASTGTPGVLPSGGTAAGAGAAGAHDGRNATAQQLHDVAQDVGAWEWLTDDVLRLDVAEHCGNDVSYFPFDEIVEAMILTLSRDAGVPRDCEVGPPQEPIVAGAETVAALIDSAEGTQFIPPCGVVPFCGFSCYACPFAFLADRLETAYPLFRAFYCRHLCKLHTISCQPATLLPLCALFESLVFAAVPHVCLHLAPLGPDAAPLREAFPWIVSGFVGYLRAEEVLSLWDRIVGFGSVELVAVLAAAIFVFRERLLLSARSAEDVELVFSDLSELKALPLLQGFMFASELAGALES